MKPAVTTLMAVAAASLFTLGSADEARAQSLTLTLQQSGALINVDDAAGRWQHEGGVILCPGGQTQAGHYAIHRRVTFTGTSAQNVAMLTATLFFETGTNPPHSITLEGTHDFDNGGYTGSVSAASSAFAAVRKQSFSGSTATDQVIINKLGKPAINPCN
jgi:hypothetical protein